MIDIKVSDPNIFFDGDVSNRDLLIDGQTVASFGFMARGTYKWQAEQGERFTISSGNLSISIDDNPRFEINENESFDVPAGSIFELWVKSPVHYEVRYF